MKLYHIHPLGLQTLVVLDTGLVSMYIFSFHITAKEWLII